MVLGGGRWPVGDRLCHCAESLCADGVIVEAKLIEGIRGPRGLIPRGSWSGKMPEAGSQ